MNSKRLCALLLVVAVLLAAMVGPADAYKKKRRRRSNKQPKDMTHDELVENYMGRVTGFVPRELPGIEMAETDNEFIPSLRFHVLGLPYSMTSKEYYGCAITQKVYNMCKMMTSLGHEVIHYGNGFPPATTNVETLTTDEFLDFFGVQPHNNNWRGHNIPVLAKFLIIERTKRELASRLRKGDIVLVAWGVWHKEVVEYVQDISSLVVDLGVGYYDDLYWPRYKVYESYAWYHRALGNRIEKEGFTTPDAYHAVINGYFDRDDFIFGSREEREDYLFYVGRIQTDKGVYLAMQLAEAANRTLIVAGNAKEFIKQINEDEFPHTTFIGPVGFQRRAELASKAHALIAPSLYFEPFGSTPVEAMMCGCPVLASDWGGFVETVEHGLTGYRCRTFDDFLWAIENVDRLDSGYIREYAESNFDISRVRWKYNEYFQKLHVLHATKEGWYDRTHRYKDDAVTLGDDEGKHTRLDPLDWLHMHHPAAPSWYVNPMERVRDAPGHFGRASQPQNTVTYSMNAEVYPPFPEWDGDDEVRRLLLERRGDLDFSNLGSSKKKAKPVGKDEL